MENIHSNHHHDLGQLITFSVLVVVFLAIVTVIGVYLNEQRRPRLVGYGCEGTAGPIYADEEDHFPKCDIIQPSRGAGQ